MGIKRTTFFRRRGLQGIKSNEHQFRECIVATRENTLITTGANPIESMTNCVCSRSACVRDDLSRNVKAELFHGINDLFLWRIICDQCCRASAAVSQAAIKVFSETHASTGGTDDNDFWIVLRELLQNFGQCAHDHVGRAMQASLPTIAIGVV